MSAQVMLEDMARKYAILAVKADKEGKVEDAITYYKKAIEVLSQIIVLYPESVARTAYEQMINEYKKRISYLEKVLPASSDGGGDGTTTPEEVVVTEKPKVSFKDIVGLDDVKEALREAIIYPTKRPDLFPLGWPRGILLYGPPGCGKTMIAAAVANEIDSIFIQLDAASVMSKWLGEAEKNVANVFKMAREESKKQNKPTIIFIDELDALLGVYSTEVGGEARVRNQFLKEMDGLLDKSENYKVYVIGATNKPWRLDEAFLRRFQKRIYVPLPDYEQRLSLFKYYTSKIKLDTEVSLEELAKLTEGYTASDIRDIVQAAHIKVVKEMFKNNLGEPRTITLQDFKDILKVRMPSVNPELIKAYEAWTEKFKAL
ncbi:AAA ATPase central domain protein [Sulfolobus islandicus Y.G.57.14]|jgi:SpoVK/Ycf46/Vps4 family AAA+-type ATPase|uniref:ATPases of the AAA+ class n=8 Tax=Saccharolobus islandicus TaxID=43080 RepID=M9UEG5_SACIS|nr:cell division protein CdvC [Sulfolobus islandicus]ACP35407.1 AAA ATPase central domain protein [Sulfolobus islandicus L.S.2.15]ACP38066.1 AAA ATPase central domain protein [Sulfolobus islandicus M.14.25]ACP45573.1 AAA ATPase central domain protein [Sulfolobus islandicus Y.G.57.14]ACR41900.1 AAA ATPase central domain protein [Sulfolobus islandicus M.16.4]ADB87092.1 AAA ATPase, central domain protein [Sulfolobus islandicus L.D.8.5]